MSANFCGYCTSLCDGDSQMMKFNVNSLIVMIPVSCIRLTLLISLYITLVNSKSSISSCGPSESDA